MPAGLEERGLSRAQFWQERGLWRAFYRLWGAPKGIQSLLFSRKPGREEGCHIPRREERVPYTVSGVRAIAWRAFHVAVYPPWVHRSLRPAAPHRTAGHARQASAALTHRVTELTVSGTHIYRKELNIIPGRNHLRNPSRMSTESNTGCTRRARCGTCNTGCTRRVLHGASTRRVLHGASTRRVLHGQCCTWRVLHWQCCTWRVLHGQ